MLNDREVVIVSACRTAIGSYLGALSDFSPGRLGAVVVREAVQRAGIRPDQVDEVIMGNILAAGAGQGIARQASIWGGVPVTTPAFTVNKLCGSGMKAMTLAAQSILLGDAEIVVAGGVEVMSAAPFILMGARKGLRMGNAQLADSLIIDGLTDVFYNVHMGVTAENIAAKYGISRQEQDEFACRSQNRAETAIKAGVFKKEIVPVEIPQKKGDPITFDQDEYPRFGCTLDGLAKLKPAFKPDGTVTAGNASGINDGAAAVVLMSSWRAAELGLTPLARLRAYSSAALDPGYMGLGPAPATHKTLERAGLTIKDIQLIEVNEAFATQVLAVQHDLGFSMDALNVNGGAIALGHPVGASGARIVVTLLHGMLERNAELGLAATCIGGGMGIAVVLERVN
jgi:acetyl-CoA C-acetyltransferase